MTVYSFGDIVLVPFPFTDQSTAKKRPAVIVSSDAYNQNRPDVVIMAVTSQTRSAVYFGDISVENWNQAGLLKPSLIKPILTTIEKGLVIRKLGRLEGKDLSSLQEAIKTILGHP
jgi:mRNA interferase MazF